MARFCITNLKVKMRHCFCTRREQMCECQSSRLGSSAVLLVPDCLPVTHTTYGSSSNRFTVSIHILLTRYRAIATRCTAQADEIIYMLQDGTQMTKWRLGQMTVNRVAPIWLSSIRQFITIEGRHKFAFNSKCFSEGREWERISALKLSTLTQVN